MEKYHIELTDEEMALVEAIDLRVAHLSHDEAHATWEANKRPILALLKSLSERRAIPEERLNYWNDPDYNADQLNAPKWGCSSGTVARAKKSIRTRISFPIFASSYSVRIFLMRSSRRSRGRSATPTTRRARADSRRVRSQTACDTLTLMAAV